MQHVENTVTKPPGAEFHALNILLAEDHPINQQLASRVLGIRGHTIDVAGNGEVVLEKLREKDFDLVLMDIQMPVMDGMEATERIRSGKESGVRADIPIIALTAHSMTGDRERFSQAGMNGYLSKPFDINELISTVETLRTQGDMGQSVKDECLDIEGLRERVGGDEDSVRDLLKSVQDLLPGQIGVIRSAMQEGNAAILRRECHALKGAAANIGAIRIRDIAAGMEKIFSGDNIHCDPIWIRQLEVEMTLVTSKINQYMKNSRRE